MGICTVQPIPLSKLPNASYSLPKPSLSRRVILTTPTATLFSRTFSILSISYSIRTKTGFVFLVFSLIFSDKILVCCMALSV